MATVTVTMRRPLHLATRALGLTYASLALIPTGFTLASAAQYARGDRCGSRALAFWAWTGWASLPLSVVLLAGAAPMDLLVDPNPERRRMCEVQRLWARVSLLPFFDVSVTTQDGDDEARTGGGGGGGGERGGGDEAPRMRPNAVWCANHNSWLDPYVLLAAAPKSVVLGFVSKREVFLIPLVGWVMGLLGHVPVERTDKQSGRRALAACREKLATAKAWSVVFFPEGSRPKTPTLGEFKMGAFKLAVEAGVPVVPLALKGTRDAMPPGKELSFLAERRTLELVVGAPIPASSSSRPEDVRDACRQRIASLLSRSARNE